MEVSSEKLNDQTDDQKSFFVNAQGLNIYCKYWYPQLSDSEVLRAAVFVCHGAGEHCQAYSKLASKLNECNMLAFAHDHVGHGLSEGERMHVSDFSTYCNDVVQHVAVIKNKHPSIPLFIIGHSMGGTIAVKVVLDNHDMFAGMVLVAPSFIICPRSLSTSSVANFTLRKFAYVFPKVKLSAISPQALSRDPQIVQEYTKDPLVWHSGVKAWWLVCFLDTMTTLRSRFSEVTCPFFVQQGTDDTVCDPTGAQMFYDNASSVHKQFKMYPGAYHQLHNEADGQGEEVVSDIVKWITDVVSS